MHIVIGILSALAGVIWAIIALRRSGISFSDLNPFLWYRRSQWKKLYSDKPIYKLENPLDVACLLLLGVAKCEGEISAQQKQAILEIFRQEFNLSADQSSDQLLASSHLIRDEVYLSDNLPRILFKSKDRFTPEQVVSLLQKMQQVACLEGVQNDEQRKLIESTRQLLEKPIHTKTGTWS